MSRDSNRPDPPGKLLRQLMHEHGWTREVLAAITGYSPNSISSVASGRSGVSPAMAVALATAFGNSAAEWLHADADYQLSLVEANTEQMSRLAELHRMAPVLDMQKRGWIRRVKPEELEGELENFFGGSVRSGISFPVATRRTVTLDHLNPAEQAWCFRARQLASSYIVDEFSRSELGALSRKLRQLAAFPESARRLASVLGKHGIRFVVVEPLPGARIDGASFWLDDGPVIAVSVRWDRIDAFWHTMLHEFFHIQSGDTYSVDTDLIREGDSGGITITLASDEAEIRANQEASNALIPETDLRSFIGRCSPLYSAERIVQFAHRVKIHPGIVVGQLQFRGELGYGSHRGFLVKIREIITATALTDGWGHELAPMMFGVSNE